MQAQSQQQEGPSRLGGGARITSGVRSVTQHFLGDLAIFADRAVGLEDRQDRLEGIAVDPGDAFDLLGPGQRVGVEPLTGGRPIVSNFQDLLARHQPRQGQQTSRQFRVLPKPAGFAAGQGCGQPQHVDLPAGVEASPGLTPLEVPVPDLRKHQEREAQTSDREATALDFSVG